MSKINYLFFYLTRIEPIFSLKVSNYIFSTNAQNIGKIINFEKLFVLFVKNLQFFGELTYFSEKFL